ncbi:hypothetical protein MKX01_002463 [Papaver californicum]|nr:hypothetical protein MKX01_002463 [Papaver californicum]
MTSETAKKKSGGRFLSSITSTVSTFGSAKHKPVNGNEEAEVINPGEVEDKVGETNGELEQDHQERESHWKILRKYIGSDITSLVAFPDFFLEPMTTVQKMAELMEYSNLLELANECENPYMQLVYASTWAVSVYYALRRTWKPFNPMLGETYEMVNFNGISFLAEQVSHHPPIGVAHAENEHFTYDYTYKLKTKLLGNSIDIYPVGRTRVSLKRDGVLLDLIPPRSKVNNLIFGRTWVDSWGDLIVTNINTKDRVVLNFKQCGWFGAGRYEVDGYVYNASEEPKILITGKWNKSISYQPCDIEGKPILGTELKEVWKVADVPENDKFQHTYFEHKLNSHDYAPNKLLESDSRLRPDRYALEKGDRPKASREKHSLEVRQRNEKKRREANGDKFTPKWFDLTEEVTSTPWGEVETYKYNGKYTEHRAKIDSNKDDEVGVPPAEFNPWQYGN